MSFVFDEVFDLPVLSTSAGELSLDHLLEQFFPGAFPLTMEEPSEVASEPAIKTLSLVQLYLDQGFVAEARQMLEHILAADPENRQARERLQSLRLAAAEEGSAQQVFKRWLGAIETIKRHRGMALLA
jgi:Tfp pilus assembly protein PilF